VNSNRDELVAIYTFSCETALETLMTN